MQGDGKFRVIFLEKFLVVLVLLAGLGFAQLFPKRVLIRINGDGLPEPAERIGVERRISVAKQSAELPK